jgi:dTDP-L-rhamnose 4-epimerase
MNVLVTGGAGFIGSHTVEALVARGDHVRVMDALTQPVHPPDQQPAFADGVEFMRGDVRSKQDWALALQGMDALIHLAAYQDYLQDFSTFFHVNAAGTALAYEVIVGSSLPIRRVVIASSQSVYGEGAARCHKHGVVVPEQRSPGSLGQGDWAVRCPQCSADVEPVPTPEELAQPRNAYGISKLAAETAALALGAQHGIPTAALRYAIVHGPGQSPRNAYSGLLRSAALALRGGRAPIVFEDGAQLRDYVAIADVVQANLVALDHPDAPGRAYNVGGARSWTVLEVVDALNAIVEEPRAPELPGAFRVGDVRHTIGDLSRLRSLGWEPTADLKTVWSQYWDWLAGQDAGADIVTEAMQDMRERGVLRQAHRSE